MAKDKTEIMVPFSLAAGDLDVNGGLWLRHLAAKNLSPHTIDNYKTAVEMLGEFLAERGMPLAVGKIKREHVEGFIAHILEARSASTAATRYRCLRPFYGRNTGDGLSSWSVACWSFSELLVSILSASKKNRR